jgi:hypothetical protein
MNTGRALLSRPATRWVLVVVLMGVPSSQYPEHRWADGAPIPTPAQRRDALTAVGYQAAPGAEWQWTEMYPDPDSGDPGPVELFAAVDVRPTGGDQR